MSAKSCLLEHNADLLSSPGLSYLNYARVTDLGLVGKDQGNKCVPGPVQIYIHSTIILFLALGTTGNGFALGKYVELQNVRIKGKSGKGPLSSLHSSQSIYEGKNSD